MIPTRRSLLSRLKNWEDQDSWQDFFDTYWKLIYSVALRSGLTESEAQEVVQETVISVAKKISEFKYDPKIGSFKSWLLHTTQWRIADQFRKRGPAFQRKGRQTNTSATATIDRIPDSAGVDMEALWEEEWKKNLFEAALERIKPQVNAKHFQIFDLYVVKKWPASRVVKMLGVNFGQIYLAKHRIAAMIKKEIKVLQNKMNY